MIANDQQLQITKNAAEQFAKTLRLKRAEVEAAECQLGDLYREIDEYEKKQQLHPDMYEQDGNVFVMLRCGRCKVEMRLAQRFMEKRPSGHMVMCSSEPLENWIVAFDEDGSYVRCPGCAGDPRFAARKSK